MLPSSPRRRRRLLWLGLIAAAAGALTLVVVLIPSESPTIDDAATPTQKPVEKGSGFAEGPPPAAPVSRLTARDRRAIDATLSRFVAAALERTDPGTAWDLAGPDLRGSSTRADWIAGRMPIYPFPASSVPQHSWRPELVTRDRVLFNLLLQPRKGSKSGAMTFSVQLQRKGSGWIVNRWYPVATFAPVGQRPRVVGPYDFTPPGDAGASTNSARLSSIWLIVPAVVLGGGALLVISFLSLRAWIGTRRARRALAGSGASSLPPLPSSFTSRRRQ